MITQYAQILKQLDRIGENTRVLMNEVKTWKYTMNARDEVVKLPGKEYTKNKFQLEKSI